MGVFKDIRLELSIKKLMASYPHLISFSYIFILVSYFLLQPLPSSLNVLNGLKSASWLFSY